MTYDIAWSNHDIPVPIPLLTKLENEYLANSKNYGMQRIEVRITPQCREISDLSTNDTQEIKVRIT